MGKMADHRVKARGSQPRWYWIALTCLTIANVALIIASIAGANREFVAVGFAAVWVPWAGINLWRGTRPGQPWGRPTYDNP